jgi:hypothetical protein
MSKPPFLVLFYPRTYSIVRRAIFVFPAPVGAQISKFSFLAKAGL